MLLFSSTTEKNLEPPLHLITTWDPKYKKTHSLAHEQEA